MHWAASRLTSGFRCGRWGLKARVPPGRLIRRQTRDVGWVIKCGCIPLPGIPVRFRIALHLSDEYKEDCLLAACFTLSPAFGPCSGPWHPSAQLDFVHLEVVRGRRRQAGGMNQITGTPGTAASAPHRGKCQNHGSDLDGSSRLIPNGVRGAGQFHVGYPGNRNEPRQATLDDGNAQAGHGQRRA